MIIVCLIALAVKSTYIVNASPVKTPATFFKEL